MRDMGLDGVLITGAGSGIGRAVALACAAPGRVLHLADRDGAGLREAAAACRALGAEVRAREIDVVDAQGMERWVSGAGRLDLVFANAGVSFNFGESAFDRDAQARDVMAINLGGMLNTVLPAMRAMAAQAPDASGVRGRIAATASLAAFLPVPGAPAYSASKAAVDSWIVASAPAARRQGLVMSSVCPGYVLTPMTAGNEHAMPGLMQPDEAARIILKGVAAGRRRIAFPWWLQACARFGGLLPPALVGRIVGLRAARGGAVGGAAAQEA